jgi:hypothetical protein
MTDSKALLQNRLTGQSDFLKVLQKGYARPKKFKLVLNFLTDQTYLSKVYLT